MRNIRTIALVGAMVVGSALAIGVVAAPPQAAAVHAARKPAPSPTPTPTPAPAPSAGPTSAAIAGYTLAQTLDISRSSAELVVPSPVCMTTEEQAVSIGLGGQADLGAPHTTAVVVVGCHGLSAPFAFIRATVGAFETTGQVAIGTRVTLEVTSSGGNAAATVRNQDTGSSIVALAGAHETSLTFGAFGVLGAESMPLSVPDFGMVKLTHNVFNELPLSGGVVVTSANSQISTGERDAAGDFSLTFDRP
ncbi:hypothetical protein [Micromonospora sp. NPDC005806]|uniref:hypothetical protein n=1 Tax=Micromonospora sp. NPDC005806 TaxID=3364234 RepID=UPI00368CC3FD